MVFYQQNKMVEAAAAFGKAVTQDPKNLEAMQMQGVSFFVREARRSDSPARTGTQFYFKCQCRPDYVLGLCYLDTGRYDDARRAFGGSMVSLPTLRRRISSRPVWYCAANIFLSRRRQREKHSKSIPVFPERICCSARSHSPTGNGQCHG